jgi:hypothetical protein
MLLREARSRAAPSLALGVARLQLRDGIKVLAELAVGLRSDPAGAAEEIEIVYILRAEVNFERGEYVSFDPSISARTRSISAQIFGMRGRW